MWIRLSDDIKNQAFTEVQNILDEAAKKTQDFINENSAKLDAIAQYLLENESMESEVLDEILYPKAHVIGFDSPTSVELKQEA
ncbi:ATP-dependent zinc metalloprotease FtsH [compost metagenome]